MNCHIGLSNSLTDLYSDIHYQFSSIKSIPLIVFIQSMKLIQWFVRKSLLFADQWSKFDHINVTLIFIFKGFYCHYYNWKQKGLGYTSKTNLCSDDTFERDWIKDWFLNQWMKAKGRYGIWNREVNKGSIEYTVKTELHEGCKSNRNNTTILIVDTIQSQV